MTLSRFSSRTARLDREFLANILKSAAAYHRIAGYFRSSIFELVGEEIAHIPEVKIVCNSELDLRDFQVATYRDSALKEVWNNVDIEAEALLHKERYQRLDSLLHAGKVEIRVVPKERLFLHGKAGVIWYPNGRRVSFMGSVNETASAFASNYELVWQDDSDESVDWVEQEFQALWKESIPLPEAILDEIHRVATRREVTVSVVAPHDLPAAALAEAPIYRGGEQLQPWQRSFVAMFLRHREIYGKARLLLADEVGVGKTFSMATSALISALLGDGAILILAPATLTWQWQTELLDKLGIPSAVWSSQDKSWLAPDGRLLSPRQEPSFISRCPHKIAIVSTGLILHQRDGNGKFIKEAERLVSRRYGTVILDEAHKARGHFEGRDNRRTPNNLLAFMRAIGLKAKNIILGTATPIQTDVLDLWDLLEILSSGADFVLGDRQSPWRNCEVAVPLLTGKQPVESVEEAWHWLRAAFPPRGESQIADSIRDLQGLPDDSFNFSYAFDDLLPQVQNLLYSCVEPAFFQDCNPILRHVVLRKREDLEKAGLMRKVGVNAHPRKDRQAQYHSRFEGLGLTTNAPFRAAYEQAEKFCSLLQERTRAAGFMKSLLLQRICSSFAAGRKTAQNMLAKSTADAGDELEAVEHILADMSLEEKQCLKEIEYQLSRSEAVDPKLDTVKWFLREFKTEGKTWLEHGCIIFSQYYDTAEWIADELGKAFPDEPVAVYAGAGRSRLFRGGESNAIEREAIKSAVKKREIRLLVATDAACEGLNLQTLGTLINIDLPWNPSRLEQRLGRIKRFGQAREVVDMLNLVYNETRDEAVYSALSDRLRDIHDIFGNLPDTIEDDWIEDEEKLRERIDAYINERAKAQNAFSAKYNASIDPDANRWERCAEVLSRRDIITKLSESW